MPTFFHVYVVASPCRGLVGKDDGRSPEETPTRRQRSDLQVFSGPNEKRTSLTLSNRYSENSNLNLKFCVALCNAILKSYAKNE